MARIITIFSPAELAILRTPATEIDFQRMSLLALEKQAKQLITTMKRGRGIGLAAPQIAQSDRMAVIHRSADPTGKHDLVLINPVIIDSSRSVVDMEEGCLSIPGVFGIVTRPTAITVQTSTVTGERLTLTADGMLARVMQHEIDHLNGILFIDHTDRFTKGRELLP